MSLRSDTVSGVLTAVFGFAAALFAMGGLGMVALQHFMLPLFKDAPPLPNGVSFEVSMRALHHVWLVYMPLLFIGGIILGVAGLRISRGSSTALRVARITTWCSYLWLIAYCVSCFRIFDLLLPPHFLPVPEEARHAFKWAWIILGFLFGAIFPTGLLFILSRPRAANFPSPSRS